MQKLLNKWYHYWGQVNVETYSEVKDYNMAKWLLVIQSNCSDSSREDDFNRWYNDIHVPDVLKFPGFTSAARYEQVFIPGTLCDKDHPTAAKAKYLAMYEIEADDIDNVIKKATENSTKLREAGRFTDLLEILARGLYRPITTPATPKGMAKEET